MELETMLAPNGREYSLQRALYCICKFPGDGSVEYAERLLLASSNWLDETQILRHIIENRADLYEYVHNLYKEAESFDSNESWTDEQKVLFVFEDLLREAWEENVESGGELLGVLVPLTPWRIDYRYLVEELVRTFTGG